MLTTRHAVDFAYTRLELDALFRYANEHDVEKGGRYDARSAGAADLLIKALGITQEHGGHPGDAIGLTT